MLDQIEQDVQICNRLVTLSEVLRKEKKERVDLLVKEVLSLNPSCTEIGAGKLSRLIELAKGLE